MPFKGSARVRGVKLLRSRLTALGLTASQFGNSKQLQALMVQRVRSRFSKRGKLAQKDPDGRPWAPLAASTNRRRKVNKDASQKLVDRGTLRRSIAVVRERQGPSVVNTGAGFRIGVVGPAARYAGVQQRGGTNPKGATIPARPFLGVGREDAEAIQALAVKVFSKIEEIT